LLTDLFEELELIMSGSASKTVEPTIETSTDVPVERLSVALRPNYFFHAVYPNNVCSRLERNMYDYSSLKIDGSYTTRWKSWGYSLCRAAVMDLACDIDSPTVSLKNLARLQTGYAEKLDSSLKRSETLQNSIYFNFSSVLSKLSDL
jgi:hypothetical protein